MSECTQPFVICGKEHQIVSPSARSYIITVLLFALYVAGFTPLSPQQRLSEDVFESMKDSVVKVITTTNSPVLPRRSATGFLWRQRDWVVTAYHVISGAELIAVMSSHDSIFVDIAWPVAIDLEADLALLQTSRTLPGAPLNDLSIDPAPGDHLWVVGYPLDVSGLRSRQLRLSEVAPKNLIDALTPTAIDELRALGFPSLTLDVLHVEGSLLPGDSGAPIVDARGRLLAIATGGLKEGYVALGWGVPSARLDTLVNSPSTTTATSPNVLARIATSFFLKPSLDQVDATLWATTYQMDTSSAYNDYLARFPNGSFAQRARARIQQLHFGSTIETGKTTDPPTPISKLVPRPIGRVTNVTVKTGYRILLVEWDRVSDADGYKVRWRFDANRLSTILVEGGVTVTADVDIPETIAGTEYAMHVIATKEGIADGVPSEVVTGRLGCFDTHGEYTGRDFSNTDLRGHSLASHNLSRSNFTGANLSGVDLSGACGESVDFQEANLSNADLSNATFAVEPGSNARARLLRVDMQHANLSGANLNRVNLYDGLLYGAYLPDASMREAYMVAADLTFALLGGADMERSRLAKANFRYAALNHANLTDASLVGARNLADVVTLEDANVNGANLRDTNITIDQLEEAIGCPIFVPLDRRPARCRS